MTIERFAEIVKEAVLFLSYSLSSVQQRRNPFRT